MKNSEETELLHLFKLKNGSFSSNFYHLSNIVHQPLTSLTEDNKTKSKTNSLRLPSGGGRWIHTLKPYQAPTEYPVFKITLCAIIWNENNISSLGNLYFSTCYWNALEKKARRGREKSAWTQRQACNVADPTRQHHKPTLTWPCRSVLSSIIAQVRQWTPSAKTGAIVNITYAQLQQTQHCLEGRKGDDMSCKNFQRQLSPSNDKYMGTSSLQGKATKQCHLTQQLFCGFTLRKI